jgi:hypothetical protein
MAKYSYDLFSTNKVGAVVKFAIFSVLPSFLMLSAILLWAFPESSALVIFSSSAALSIVLPSPIFYAVKRFITPKFSALIKKHVSPKFPSIENHSLQDGLALSKGVAMSIMTGLSAAGVNETSSPARVLAALWANYETIDSTDPDYVKTLYQQLSYILLASLVLFGAMSANKAFRPDEGGECNNYCNKWCPVTTITDFLNMLREFYEFSRYCCGSNVYKELVHFNQEQNNRNDYFTGSADAVALVPASTTVVTSADADPARRDSGAALEAPLRM